MFKPIKDREAFFFDLSFVFGDLFLFSAFSGVFNGAVLTDWVALGIASVVLFFATAAVWFIHQNKK